MLSCSPTRRSWSAMCRASGSARRRPGSGAATGRSAPIRRMPIRPGWRACSSRAWPNCPAGDIPAAAAGHRAVAVSFRKPTRTPRWPALRNFGDDTERPRYKCKPPRLRVAPWRVERAATCDTLIERLGQLAKADPSLLLQSHPVTSDLAGQPSPVSDPAYKHREDLIDACCAPGLHHRGRATASTAARSSACPPIPRAAPAATMIVPARQDQRLQPLPESALFAADPSVCTGPGRRVGAWVSACASCGAAVATCGGVSQGGGQRDALAPVVAPLLVQDAFGVVLAGARPSAER